MRLEWIDMPHPVTPPWRQQILTIARAMNCHGTLVMSPERVRTWKSTQLPRNETCEKWPAMMTYPDKTHHVTLSTSWWMIMNARSALISHCRNPSCLQQIVAEGIAVLRTIGTAATSFGRLGSKKTEYEVWHAKISRSLHRTQSNHLERLCQMCGKRSLVTEKKLCTSYQSQLLTLACQNWE